MKPRAIDPYKLMLLDGVEHEFYLTNAVQRRATTFAAKSLALKDIPKDSMLYPLALGEEFLVAGFYEACADKGDLTLEQFSELLPGDTAILTAKWEELKVLHSRPWMPVVENEKSQNPPATAG